MKRLGRLISWIGAAIGVALGFSMLLPAPATGGAWILAVGLSKLVFAGAIGLIALGAVVERIAIRAAAHEALPPSANH